MVYSEIFVRYNIEKGCYHTIGTSIPLFLTIYVLINFIYINKLKL